MQNVHVITLDTPLRPLVHEDTNQNFAAWLGAHANLNYRTQAGAWLFPADVNALNGLRSRKRYASPDAEERALLKPNQPGRHILALCEFLQIPQAIWPAVAPNTANASVAERNLVMPEFRTKLGLSPV